MTRVGSATRPSRRYPGSSKPCWSAVSPSYRWGRPSLADWLGRPVEPLPVGLADRAPLGDRDVVLVGIVERGRPQFQLVAAVDRPRAVHERDTLRLEVLVDGLHVAH